MSSVTTLLLLSVAIVWGVAVITPGPNFFITVQTAVERSRSAALFVVLGIAAGTTIWAISGFLGINLLFRAAPWIYASLKIAGGCYLVYLGGKLLLVPSNRKVATRDSHSDHKEALHSFKLGFFTNISNPKTAAFMTSLFAAAMPSDATISIGFLSIALIVSISVCWYALVAYLFSLDRFQSLYRRARVWIERAAGAVFVAFGVKLAVSD